MPAHTDAPEDGGAPEHSIEGPGSVLGSYRIIESIGEGGFGTVFRAQQNEPVRREVALKIIKLGMDTRQIVARFVAERQALALMDHPSIAKVYDAGATATGRPYFVMELVPGLPITDFCDREKLSMGERLALFRQVCHAVQHAHQKGVLHRDLKPSNILVARVDGLPQPKVIDFGIAKALEKPLTDSSQATEAFQVMGTPEYMAPEQASGVDVDTRVDVYSLGVVLYELLTGAPPFARVTGGLDELSELLRCIHEVTPAKPSTRVGELSHAAEENASKHSRPTSIYVRSLRGDLDWIVMRALEKDRERRYASASELAEDIQRHLSNEPVLASPPSRVYRLQKFVRRNRLLVGSVAIVAVTLVGSSVGLGALYARSVDAEARATRKAETSRQALGFMVDMFEVSDPSQARGETVTAREILDQGAARIERELSDQPEIRSTLMASMGRVYAGLGLYDRAETLIESAATERRVSLGDEDPEVLQLSSALADVWMRMARLDEAEATLRATVERQRRVLGSEHADTLDSLIGLSQVLARRSQFDEAEELAAEAATATRRTFGPDHELTLRALEQSGMVHMAAGRFDEAERRFTDVLSTRRRLLAGDHPRTMLTIGNLADLYRRMGRFESAETLLEEALATAVRVLGPEHRETLQCRGTLGVLYFEQQRWEDAEQIQRAIVAVQRRTLGDLHPDTLTSLTILGAALSGQKRLEEAEGCYLEALDGLRGQFGDHHDQTLSVTGNLAIFYLDTGRLEDAQALARQVYEDTKALHGEDHPDTILRLENLGNILYKRHDVPAAAEILDRVLQSRRRSLGNEHPAVTRTLVNLSIVRADAGDDVGATVVREELLARTLDGLGFDYLSVAEQLQNLASDLYEQGEFERAAECTAEILRIRVAAVGTEDPATLTAMRGHMRILAAAGRWPEVAARATEFYGAHVDGLGAAHEKTADCARILADGFEAEGDALQAAAWRAKVPAGKD